MDEQRWTGHSVMVIRGCADIARVVGPPPAPAGTVPQDERGTDALVLAYVEADGSSDDPAEAAACAAADAATVRV